MAKLQTLPADLLVLLPSYLHNIEDYTNLASTCRLLRQCMYSATPNDILRLAAAQTSVFFRPSPYFLVAATAKELGNWARLSATNEEAFALQCKQGIDGLMNLALEHCGLTMERIRHLYQMRFSIINPVTNIIDQCVGKQWCSLPRFWHGNVSDAATIHSDPSVTFFHLAIYGELFAPDLEAIMNKDSTSRRLKAQTRLEYIKYCVPEYQLSQVTGWRSNQVPEAHVPFVSPTGPYHPDNAKALDCDHHQALVWTLNSSRWKPHWQRVRALAGGDFQDDFDDTHDTDYGVGQDWRQRMWENVMVTQGLDGLGMIVQNPVPDVWISQARAWRDKIADLGEEPAVVRPDRQLDGDVIPTTREYPHCLRDLRVIGYDADLPYI